MASVFERMCNSASTGLEPRGLHSLVDALHYGMLLMYIGQKMSMVPLTDHTPGKHERNQEIRVRHATGETVVGLAAAFDISQQRVSQILRHQRK
jgi:Mor family transcriptional regulator